MSPASAGTLPLARLPHPQMPTERRFSFRAECLETNNTLGSLTHKRTASFFANFKLLRSTEPGNNICTWLRVRCWQVEAEVVRNG